MQCKAKSKQSGERCKRHAVPGKEVCAIHGGKSLSGLAAPNYKTGRYSKSLPVHLATRYEEAINSPALMELRDEIALVDTRLTELLAKVQTGENKITWQEALKAFDALRIAITRADAEKVREGLNTLRAILQNANNEARAWDSIFEALESRRRLVESERTHQKQMQQLVSVDQMMLLAGALLASVKQHVGDKRALMAISRDIDLYLGSR